ncbi:phosphonate C-P lyase system protein PhnH [Magnetospirillum sp. UT-4]|uniref:phosphonate C-P lyase system protein PhnH n=1 Tax=Magnetospirillum sp. UT-4 TaxID=2681467 RepID=UPI0013835613|nr:phosphonate C-P lyase system protein PhnH [Magnetospirillum sp. UT-4]CAA7616883.1 Alpha-D-ribose 1-methylphosphonate 5-triphosphate synthase subunit PhnH [Magnetospirillum sp. UT-4]
MTAVHATDGLLPGFADPVLDSQRVFRAVLEATARPGTLVELPLHLEPPAPLDAATAAVMLALADYETPLWLDGTAATDAVAEYLRFHCGCPLVSDPAAAAFALIADASIMPPLAAFHAGSDEYPDRSTTLVIQVATLTAGEPVELSGPGIRDSARLAAGAFPPDFPRWVAANHELFPRGVDLVLASGRSLAALPRSTRLEW